MATTNHTHFLSCDIAGFTFHDGAIVMCDLAVGKKLRLVRESGNIHDPNAIAIWFGDSMLACLTLVANRDQNLVRGTNKVQKCAIHCISLLTND